MILRCAPLGVVSQAVSSFLGAGDSLALADALDAVTSHPLPNARYVQRVVEEVLRQCARFQMETPEAAFDLLACAVRGGDDGGFMSFFTTDVGGVVREPLRVWSSALLSDVSTSLWPAAFHLIDGAVRVFARSIAGRHVLELGAGTGLVGLALSRLVQPAPRVTITDGCVKACERARTVLCCDNTIATRDGKVDLAVELLDWMDEVPAWAHEAAEVIVASDVVYDPTVAPALTKTLSALLDATADADTIILPANSSGAARTADDDFTSSLFTMVTHGEVDRFALFANELRNAQTYEAFVREVEAAGLMYADITDRVAAWVQETGGAVLERTDAEHNVRLAIIVPKRVAFSRCK